MTAKPDADPAAAELAAHAEELYAAAPEDFTAARNGRVKEAKARGARELAAALGALRKPSTAAWLMNQLVRRNPDEVEALLSLGEALREAQADLDRDAMKELNRRRQQVVAGLGRQARALSRQLGHPASDDIERDVEQTLAAGLADEAAAAAIRSGRLLRALSYAGFGDVDTDGAVAAPDAQPSGRAAAGRPSAKPAKSTGAGDHARAEQRARQLAEAREEEQEARRAAGETAALLADAERRVQDVTARRRELEARIEELTEQLALSRDQAGHATREARDAVRDRDGAAKKASAASLAADRAGARAQRLTDP